MGAMATSTSCNTAIRVGQTAVFGIAFILAARVTNPAVGHAHEPHDRHSSHGSRDRGPHGAHGEDAKQGRHGAHGGHGAHEAHHHGDVDGHDGHGEHHDHSTQPPKWLRLLAGHHHSHADPDTPRRIHQVVAQTMERLANGETYTAPPDATILSVGAAQAHQQGAHQPEHGHGCSHGHETARQLWPRALRNLADVGAIATAAAITVSAPELSPYAAAGYFTYATLTGRLQRLAETIQRQARLSWLPRTRALGGTAGLAVFPAVAAVGVAHEVVEHGWLDMPVCSAEMAVTPALLLPWAVGEGQKVWRVVGANEAVGLEARLPALVRWARWNGDPHAAQLRQPWWRRLPTLGRKRQAQGAVPLSPGEKLLAGIGGAQSIAAARTGAQTTDGTQQRSWGELNARLADSSQDPEHRRQLGLSLARQAESLYPLAEQAILGAEELGRIHRRDATRLARRNGKLQAKSRSIAADLRNIALATPAEVQARHPDSSQLPGDSWLSTRVAQLAEQVRQNVAAREELLLELDQLSSSDSHGPHAVAPKPRWRTRLASWRPRLGSFGHRGSQRGGH
jgi:hypothetical protein